MHMHVPSGHGLGRGKGVVAEEGGSSKRGRGAVEAIALIV